MTVHDSKGANLVDHGWELESAVARSKASARFPIPTEQERRTLAMGDHVQLLFLFADKGPDGGLIAQGERMWVAVAAVEGDEYVGVLQSSPLTSSTLTEGDRVRFGAEHVARLLVPRSDGARGDN
jgi:uncharacterized protein DUF2314